MEKKMSKMKSNAVYNQWDNMVMVKTNGDEINVICNSEAQMDKVVKRLSTDTCLLTGYEEWDEGKDKKWILKFLVCGDEYEIVPEFN
tara:strand:+ start:771 stop:1031 length:261 start_codon:yes stop_codon:yes gene_type:complete